MKAYYATAWGGPEVMRYGDLPDPTPAPGELRDRGLAGYYPCSMSCRSSTRTPGRVRTWR